jgi:hypothetical protein
VAPQEGLSCMQFIITQLTCWCGTVVTQLTDWVTSVFGELVFTLPYVCTPKDCSEVE